MLDASPPFEPCADVQRVGEEAVSVLPVPATRSCPGVQADQESMHGVAQDLCSPDTPAPPDRSYPISPRLGSGIKNLIGVIVEQAVCREGFGGCQKPDVWPTDDGK
jgi:hypothetical protein